MVVFRFRNGVTLCRNNDFWTGHHEVEAAEFAARNGLTRHPTEWVSACSYILQAPHPAKVGEFSVKVEPALD
jgi:hypothetical protein